MDTFWLSLGCLVIAAAACRVIVTHARRRRALRGLAREERLNFSPEDLIGIHERYYNLEMIRQGHSRHTWNVLYSPTADGLATVFCYHYEVGFDVRCTAQRWWFAVMETPDAYHPHWQAEPADSSGAGASGAIDGFRLWSDHAATRERLIEAGIERVFAAAPAECRWEARGPLVAVAVPFDPDPRTPRRLLTTARELTRLLAAAGA